ncbi:MAG: leucyl aminopeptidase, partial [Gemmatimonadota bacterium]
MQLRYVDDAPEAHETELLACAVTRGTQTPEGALAALDELLGGRVARVLASGDMKGHVDEEILLYADDSGPRRILLLGVGEPGEITAEVARRMAARAVRYAERLDLASLSVCLDGLGGLADEAKAQAVAEGAALAAWRFRELRAPLVEDPEVDVTSVALVGAGDTDALATGTVNGAIVARAENFARMLQSRPGNLATPSLIAQEAERMAGAVGLEVTVFDEARMAAEGMHAILAVSQGSEQEARLVVLEHKGGKTGDPPLVLVGKGLSFDAGGISIKPAAGMERMKFDMSGGAAVIAAMQAIAELGVRANVVGIVPSSENLPSGSAVKPGDVIRTLAGKTVEVINTDAEGRLILADALAYGARMKPAAMVDCATLTGGVVVALGHHAAAVLGNDDELIDQVIDAGEKAGQRCWELPIWEDYKRQLDSETADLQNVGG